MPDVHKKLAATKDKDGMTLKIARSWDDVTKVGVRKVFGQQVLSMCVGAPARHLKLLPTLALALALAPGRCQCA